MFGPAEDSVEWMSLKEILQEATYFFVILTRNAVCVRRETGLFGVVCNYSGMGYPVLLLYMRQTQLLHI